MKDYSLIAEIQVTDSSDKANSLLEDWWILLDVFHNNEGGLFFVLGRERSLDLEMLYKVASGKKVICDE